MRHAVWLLCALALAACDRPSAAVEPAGVAVTTASARRLDEALDRFERAVTENPGDHATADRYREAALARHAGPRAIQHLQQLAADARTGRVANVHYQLGMAYVDALKTAPPTAKSPLSNKALASFDAALTRNPDLWEARYAKGLLFLRMPADFKQYPRAIETFTELLARQARQPQRPEFSLTYLRLSEAYVAANDRRHAEQVLRDGLTRFPDQPALREALAALPPRGVPR